MKRKLNETDAQTGDQCNDESAQEQQTTDDVGGANANENSEENDSTADTDESSTKKKKRFSPVWKHFSIKSENNIEVAHCNYCDK